MLKKIGYVNVSKYDIDKVAQILAALAYDYGETVETMAKKVSHEAQNLLVRYTHYNDGSVNYDRVVINESVAE